MENETKRERNRRLIAERDAAAEKFPKEPVEEKKPRRQNKFDEYWENKTEEEEVDEFEEVSESNIFERNLKED